MSAYRKIALSLAGAALCGGLTVAAPAQATPARHTAAAAPAAAAAECGVRADARLWCGNRVGAKGYVHRSYGSGVRGTLTTGFSWFQCWGRGDTHLGGNNVWYWTKLDNGQWGNVPAADVHTRVDPAPGLREC
ncbi:MULTISPECIES: hypothetical protein [Streptomyces]|uniref:Peptidase inhibitor family I36 n=1 Tax=Streptomyces griseoaurantiacus TaxID=68213 RepID=A0ABZ1VDF2_9ACTN|nr:MULTISPECIES: hypothetical protein [Streptomyces]MDX3088511.1 hypothetical protein [Streptomyces sp. ME12-02E]MDX3331960.1 hypothetical protein [Streptomyces sp. ME02-6978a]GHE48152.1 hypothetical protein GCM10018782_23460 [Streptomyces griseoaurantiacus]